MGSKKSSASSSTTTNTQDNSAVAGNNAVALAAGASYSNWFQTSDTYAVDASDRSSRTDNSGNTWVDGSVGDYSDRSTNIDASLTDYSDRSTSVYALDSRDLSTSIYALDSSNRSTTNSYSDTSDRSQSWYALDNSDRSVTATDSREWYSYASDSRDLSTDVRATDARAWTDNSVTNTMTYTGTDPGILAWQQTNAELLGAVAESQTDAVQFMTSAGADVLRRMGESATSLYSVAGKNNAESWGDTLRASEAVLSGTADRVGALWGDTLQRSTDLLGQITQRAGNTADAAGRLADLAITSYQPPENAQAGAMKWGLIALAGVAALFILPRVLKA
jgi:hypothetical protein